MERTLKSAVKLKPRQGAFLFPGALEAEPWELWISGGPDESRFAQTCAAPRDNPWQKKSTLVLPAAQVFCLPLWLNESEPDRLPGMIELQLEARALAGGPAIYQWSVAAQEEKRTLVLVGLLPSDLPGDLRVSSYQSFDASVRYFAWPENALTLWLEQGRLAVAFTRGPNLVYFQNLGEARCTERTLQTLICLRASLEMQGLLSDLFQIVLWTDLSPVEQAALENVLQLPVHSAERPAPKTPAIAWNLSPPEVVRFKQERHARRWKGRALLIAFAAYLLIPVFLIGQFLFMSYRVDGLRHWQSDHAAALASIQRAQDDWQHLQPVVDTGNYPLEILLHCASAIPQDQLHLTLFEINEDKVLLKGEATNVAAAYLFCDRLKSEPQLSAYTWKMDEPHLLPNDLAQLQIEGSHATSNP
jgi:hypothetical protein